jgi:hypothetical protein
MKVLQTAFLILLTVSVASAQRADVKGPKAKNLKVYEHPEMFAGQVVTSNEEVKKGPERKNAKRRFAATNQDTIAVVARPENAKGPKAKNRKVWQ